MKNHYETLDLPRHCGPDEIKKSFRGLAFRWHPDVRRADPVAGERFREIREAYETLVDAELRSQYDSLLDSHLSSFTSSRKPSSSYAASSAYAQPRARKDAKHEKYGFCRAGIHSGSFPWDSPYDIPLSLEVSMEASLKPSLHTFRIPAGFSEAQANRVIQVPGALFDGALLRVQGGGYMNPRTGQRGDLWVSVSLTKSPSFRSLGSHLHCDVTVLPWQSALGETVEVATLDGTVKVALPSNFQSRSNVRIPERGLFDKNGQRGDFWVHFRMNVPTCTGERARRLWEELAKECGASGL